MARHRTFNATKRGSSPRGPTIYRWQRGFGHKIATRFLTRAGAKDDMDSAPVALDYRTQEGQDYVAAMNLAGRYAYAGP